ncbi:hypothetical protein JI59_16020 [Novosphingobium pentaromativorans US6-1]|uniref:DUF192 domain-containing protein n=2 Tax=Novosphingobium pentaromativorans TaxID=205844 RepID=G6E8Z0_9SPHN|nr:hypothetical protein JI59_16020 [Novosphingobium pentaromativorans US6-1]EHJ62214.1 hypothetical protein NSU_0811 [Novosphingobium pentaromativorans US6-1]
MRLNKAFTAAAATFLMIVGGCSQGGQEAVAKPTAPLVHPISGLEVVPLIVKSQGKVHKFSVEVAKTEEEQAKGLMFRTEMGPDEGMIFPEDPPRRPAFWMRNTVIPLDIIFIGTDHRILNIAANAVPYDETPLPAAGMASGVLELNGGRAAELGIKPGDKVEW